MPALSTLRMTRFDSMDDWEVRGNGTSVLPLTGGFSVQINFYAGQKFHQLQVVNEDGDIIGWCSLTTELNERSFYAVQRIVDSQLSQGRGPRELARYFDDIREGRVTVGKREPATRTRFQLLDEA